MIWVKQASSLCSAESGLAGRYWFSAVNHGKDCWNVTFKYHLDTTPYIRLYGMRNFRKRMFQISDLLDARHMFIWTRRGERKENIHPKQWKQYTLDSHSIAMWVRTSFIFPRQENVLYQIKPNLTRSHSLTGIRTWLAGSWTQIKISKFCLWTSCLQGGLTRISRQRSVWINMRKYMLEMENLAF